MKQVLALCVLLFAGVASGATISGTVDAGGGFSVAAYMSGGTPVATTTTNAAGAYTLTVAAGTYRVLAYDPNGVFATSFYADADSFETSKDLVLTSATALTNINFHLVRAGYVAGHISGPASAVVAAYNAQSGTRRGFTTTDSGGNFRLALPPGSYAIAAYDEAVEYAPAVLAENVTIVAGETVTANLTLPLAANIAGVARDHLTLAPLAGINVTAYATGSGLRVTATTDANGRYSIIVPAGDYVVAAFGGDYVSQIAPATIHVAGRQTVSADFALTKGARASGHVTARASGVPLPGITVAAYDLNGRVVATTATDPTGAYALLVPPGTVKLLAFDDALQFATAYYLGAATFDETQPVALAEAQTLTADFAMSVAGRVTGNVTNAGSAALAGMQVIAYDAGFRNIAETTTDANGAFRLALPPGTYVIAVADPLRRYVSQLSDAVTVAPQQTVGPIPFRLNVAPVAPRKRAVRH